MGLACALLAAAAACRSADWINTTPELAHQLGGHGFAPGSVVVPWELTGEMRRWAHEAVPDTTPSDSRLERLLSAMLAPDGLNLVYQAGVTGTAQEVFETHRANCLSFTSLFVGMARELGVPVYYLDVGDIEKYEKEGNLVVESGHVTAGYGRGSMLRILEFAPQGKANYHHLHPISDLTAIALYYSNRGAEMLRSGQQDEALTWLRKAVALDPGLARGWINLGVVLRRSGDSAGAESAYRKALEIDPTAVAGYQDLAALLYSTGRSREGAELLALTAKLDSRNPFNLLALGDVSLAHGRLEEARHFYRQAQRLDGKVVETYAALGEVALASGDTRQARRWLKKATELDGSNERVLRLTHRLQGAGPPAVHHSPTGPAAPTSPSPSGAGSGPAGPARIGPAAPAIPGDDPA